MRLIRLLPIVAGLSGIALAQKVVTQFDRSVDFSPFKTYKWVEISGSQHVDSITARNIQNMVNSDLASKGLVQGTGDVDLLVGFQTAVSKQQQLNWYNSGGAWGWGGGFGQASTETIETGALTVDIYATSTHHLIWRGTVTKTLNPSGNPDKNYENLQKAVNKLMKEYPPKPKG